MALQNVVTPAKARIHARCDSLEQWIPASTGMTSGVFSGFSANSSNLNYSRETIAMNKMIISVLGKDRPGIIAAVTKVLFEKDFNIEDVSQTILQNQFSGIFIASGPQGFSPGDLCRVLESETIDFGLHFYVSALSSEAVTWTSCDCEPFIITTRGPDRKGLVANVTALLASHNVNVTQLRAVFRGGTEPGKNVMIYDVDIPMDIDQNRLRKDLQTKGDELNIQISIQHKKIFKAINRI
jgi:glycine cleavage system transcriptional repressor